MLLAAACSFEAKHGTGYKCVDDGDCPEGQACVDLVCGGAAAALGDGAPSGGGVPDAGLTNLLENAGFESANVSDWHEYNSSVERSEMARTGSFAGYVCRADQAEAFTTYNFMVYEPVPTGQYHARAYVRGGGEGETLPMRLTIRESTPDGYVNHDGDEVQVGDSWVPLTADADVAATDLSWIQVIVWGLTGAEVCFLVDDTSAVLVE